MGFLDPYRVLDLTNERGLMAGRMLADLGADVIQIEPPTGSPARQVPPFAKQTDNDPGGSLYWDAFAANKRGITLDLDSAEGKETFLKLCETADFLFESETPGTMAKRGLAWEDVRKVNPKLIYTSITPFGSTGPKANYADTELICWASATPLFPNREEDRPPLRISVPQAYYHASADAVSGALIAHAYAVKTGIGQHVDLSVQESCAQATLSRILAAAVEDHYIQKSRYGAPPVVKGKKILDQSGSGSQTGRTKWKVKDGYIEFHLALGPATGAFTNRFLAWMNEEGITSDIRVAGMDWTKMNIYVADNEVSMDEIEVLRERLTAWFANQTKRILLDASLTYRLLIAPVFNVGDLGDDQHLNQRNLYVDFQSTDGRKRRLPARFAHTNVDAHEFRRGAPALGEHNDEILGELKGGKAK